MRETESEKPTSDLLILLRMKSSIRATAELTAYLLKIKKVVSLSSKILSSECPLVLRIVSQRTEVLTWNFCLISRNDNCPVDEGNDMWESKNSPMKDAKEVFLVAIAVSTRWREESSDVVRDWGTIIVVVVWVVEVHEGPDLPIDKISTKS